ncbi:hypothetical protein ACRE_002250 [Hapsidospora chrysogenum ATCC 11550]|uniref:Uncharacterized protein n=1 Tax=Hapsidospora chrysogenum (strain ATCC 11550 / CBS 779.69 / DSM 880 / IAM 14645 / JCM 23072 / IMI 49137) TaxID=857340 RepID=A0A086THT3_HAPC1|nr:hypothetical protein ACRE_002250 [Hapsidospora chrysogenum ATCC 11550]
MAEAEENLATEASASQQTRSLENSNPALMAIDPPVLKTDDGNGHCSPSDDIQTEYSTNSTLDDPFLEAFADQLCRDLADVFRDDEPSRLAPEYLDSALKKFAWKLHGESSNTFQRKASVTLHRKRKDIVERLFQITSARHNRSKGSDTADESGEGPGRQPFHQPVTATLDWLDGVTWSQEEGPSQRADEAALLDDTDALTLEPPDSEEFIRESGSYKWLLCIMRQHRRLRFRCPYLMSEIGTKVLKHLGAHERHRKLSHRRLPSATTMTFHLDWNPIEVLRDNGIDPTLPSPIEGVLCLTGTIAEAQAATVGEYMAQTWPMTWRPLVILISELVSTVEGQPYLVSEIAEQLGWLAAALRSSPVDSGQGVVYCEPDVKGIQVQNRNSQEDGTASEQTTWSCRMTYDLEQISEASALQSQGFCWGTLFWNPILVKGYPTLTRPVSDTGLEVSLRTMAFLLRSEHFVQWGKRIILKGFSSMVVAIRATAGVVVWHLFSSPSPDERISYTDPRVETLSVDAHKGLSLRDLETHRHIIGWCASAMDLCGRAAADLHVGPSGSRTPPASLVIDNLHLEGGVNVIVGVNMFINKKEQPVHVRRTGDYPAILGRVGMQPIMFYDTASRRAWLTDGASALLHLVRISLHLDGHDPNSTYDWVFDPAKLKDEWENCTGRQAALKTLKN